MRSEKAMIAMRLSALPGQEQELATLDEAHLGRMTLGDRRLEQEVLEIFARQNSLILTRIAGAEPGPIAAAAHTLKGSARGVGAWRVVRAAGRLEQAATEADEDAMKAAIAELEAAFARRSGRASASAQMNLDPRRLAAHRAHVEAILTTSVLRREPIERARRRPAH